MQEVISAITNRPSTLHLSDPTASGTTSSTTTNGNNFCAKVQRKSVDEKSFRIYPWWNEILSQGLPRATLSPRLRRTHSLIVTRPPSLPSATSHILRTRSRSTASTPCCTNDDSTMAFFERKISADLIGPRLLEALQENRVLTNANENVNNKPERFECLRSPSYEQPLKVFSKVQSASGLPNEMMLDRGSCHAVRSAVSTLYNFEDFEMVKIGEGFFSEVYKVVHKTLGKVMVLKRNKHRANRNAMLKEIQLLNTLSHENILRYEGACVHEGQLHALAEYVEGGSLDQLIQKVSKAGAENELPWKLRVSLARDVTRGLEYLHSRGFFHRDLTSKNILIRLNQNNSRPMTAVVADFGLAAPIPKSPEEHLQQVGSPYWMSPECLRGKFYNETADVFSFGIILCEMIACVEADPDLLPRTENFGVDYLAFSELVPAACPPDFLKMAFTCVSIDPNRPSFKELNEQLGRIEEHMRIAEESEKLKKLEEQKMKASTQTKTAQFYTETPVKNGTALSRRCLSQRKPTRCSPSEVARHHVTSSSGLPQKRIVNLETPVAIGEQMSKLDPFYIPSPATGINPFAQLPRRLSTLGGGKIFGPKDLFYSCFELSEEKFFIPESTTTEAEIWSAAERSDSPLYRKAVSMINHEPLSTDDLIAEVDHQIKSKN